MEEMEIYDNSDSDNEELETESEMGTESETDECRDAGEVKTEIKDENEVEPKMESDSDGETVSDSENSDSISESEDSNLPIPSTPWINGNGIPVGQSKCLTGLQFMVEMIQLNADVDNDIEVDLEDLGTWRALRKPATRFGHFDEAMKICESRSFHETFAENTEDPRKKVVQDINENKTENTNKNLTKMSGELQQPGSSSVTLENKTEFKLIPEKTLDLRPKPEADTIRIGLQKDVGKSSATTTDPIVRVKSVERIRGPGNQTFGFDNEPKCTSSTCENDKISKAEIPQKLSEKRAVTTTTMISLFPGCGRDTFSAEIQKYSSVKRISSMPTSSKRRRDKEAKILKLKIPQNLPEKVAETSGMMRLSPGCGRDSFSLEIRKHSSKKKNSSEVKQSGKNIIGLDRKARILAHQPIILIEKMID